MNLPPFTLETTTGTISHQDFASGKAIIYAYPKDSTPGCTLESIAFESLKSEFAKLGFTIYGLSKDSVKSHHKFCEKSGMTFCLISDPDLILLRGLKIMKEKSMFGKTYMGVDRSTFVIEDGVVIKEWRSVKAKGHAQAVLSYCQGL